MTEMKMILLWGFLGSVSGQFFHEPSGVTLKPSGGQATSSAFGFSIAYQDHTGLPARLVIGAPKQDYVGKVYSCPLSDLSSIYCSVIDMKSLKLEENTAAARKEKNPMTNYFFGSSIAATSDYFLTCAPLLTKKINNMNFSETFGGCYVNNYATSRYSEWIDSTARLEDKHRRSPIYPVISLEDEEIIGGALGWNTLVDDSFLIAAKSGYKTDILYTNAEHPLENASKSLLEDNQSTHRREFKNYFNLGYGLAVGNFFSKSEKLYAVSARTDSNEMIFFLKKKYGDRGYYLDMVHEIGRRLAYIDYQTQSSMFGYAMAAADVNRDGLSELLVGAPAQTKDGIRELGALHVFVGGDLISRNDKKRMRTVLADKVNGRFGSAIATSDIDGDSIPEIFVSAPYEGSGVVYVLSGYELKQVFFKEDGFKLTRLSELKLTQELRGDGGFKLFGFSLQVVKDVDQNGCDELAIGAPDSNLVKLVRCLPAVNTSITLELVGNSTVAVDAKSFKIKVCLSVTINKKCKSVSGNILVESFTTGYSKISDPKFTHNIRTDKELDCKEITVDLTPEEKKKKLEVDEQTDYTFTTKLSMTDDPNPSAYRSRAVFSAYSEKEKSLTVRRYCIETYCEPDLSYKTFWPGNDFIDISKPEALNDTLTYEIKNANYVAHRVVLELVVEGALVRSGECTINKNTSNVNDDVKVYTCVLPKKLEKDELYNMTVPIYLPAPTNRPSLNIRVSAKLYDAVFPNKAFQDEEPRIKSYKLNASDVTVRGSSNSVNVTDIDLEKDEIKYVESSGIQQEFIISNDGPVTWNGILAVLHIKKKYIQNVTIETLRDLRSENEEWLQQYDPNDSSKFIYHNRMTLLPNSKKITRVSIRLFRDKLESDLSKGDLSIISELSFVLDPLSESREARSSTQIHYEQIRSVGNQKWKIILIVVILAILLLLFLMLVLYKLGFFKRAEKKKLSVFRENIRKQSVGVASESSRGVRPSMVDGDHFDIEVFDDSFHEEEVVPSTTRSNISLIETSQKEHASY